MAVIPPWLNVSPSQFTEAYQTGIRAGLSAAAQRMQAQQAAQRAAQIAEAERVRQWETQQRMAMAEREMAQKNQLGLESLAAQKAFRDASLAFDREKLAETQQYHEGLLGKGKELTPYQQWRMDNANAPKIYHVGNKLVSIAPTGEQTTIYEGPYVADAGERAKISAMAKEVDQIDKILYYNPEKMPEQDRLMWEKKKALLVAEMGAIGRGQRRKTNPVNVAPSIPTVPEVPAAPAPAGPRVVPPSWPQQETGRVRVKSPDGKTGTISIENLEEALKAGYTEIE